jgi:hypothetical protein
MESMLESTEGSEELKPVEQAGIEEYLIPEYPEFTVKDGVMNLNPPPLELNGADQSTLNVIFSEYKSLTEANQLNL